MNEFNPNCGKCGMLNSRGFCSLTACRYPSNVIVAEPKVIRGMMVNPQIEKPMTNFDEIKAMNVEELATFFGTLPCCPPGNADELCFPDNTCGADTKMMVKCWGTWLKSPVEEVDQ